MALTKQQVEKFKNKFESSCERAAKEILGADFLLLSTGAGFSADSGLAVYKDIANIPAYLERKLSYFSLCQPHLLEGDEELFFGFWGDCSNTYRNTTPHEGYSIIKSWRDIVTNNMRTKNPELFDKLTEMQELKLKKREELKLTKREQKKSNKSDIDTNTGYENCFSSIPKNTPTAGPFYIHTSNVDNHSVTAGFNLEEVAEIHGSIEYWQCSKVCTSNLWKLPKEYRFKVNSKTMLCDPKSYQKCIQPNCSEYARPNILMFTDFLWRKDKDQAYRFHAWKKAVSKIINENESEDGKRKKIVILEIGCGTNVPSVRMHSERLLNTFPVGSCTLIRINLDFPLIETYEPRKDEDKNCICIHSKGLPAILQIQQSIQSLQS